MIFVAASCVYVVFLHSQTYEFEVLHHVRVVRPWSTYSAYFTEKPTHRLSIIKTSTTSHGHLSISLGSLSPQNAFASSITSSPHQMMIHYLTPHQQEVSMRCIRCERQAVKCVWVSRSGFSFISKSIICEWLCFFWPFGNALKINLLFRGGEQNRIWSIRISDRV